MPTPDSTDPRSARTGPILVTGAFGLVGTATLRRLLGQGYEVVATDLDLPANRRAAQRLADPNLRIHWADLTDPGQVDAVIGTVAPTHIVHLAAIIPPQCYRNPRLARAVNVDATAALLRAAAAQPAPPRFVQASSIAVHGTRNPHRADGPLRPDTPIRPVDVYGAHKAEAEHLIRSSSLEWVILRLAAVLSVDLDIAVNADMLHFQAALPGDGRIQTVDVRDIATAIDAALTTPATGEAFLIGGDSTHRQRHQDVTVAMATAIGLTNAFPPARPGNPDRDDDWFTTDWVDTQRSQQILAFQHHSWPAMLDEIRATAGPLRYLARPVAPLVRLWLRRLSPYRGNRQPFADPWNAIRPRLGNPYPEDPVQTSR
ncbi:NAD-dependent epimerase/dehydratase family protein [Nocardia sp. alder85J]|uniref:NAD-dependent epimerase/dehydratase family protein n=1 Tax=Nocardia sp. alder85J TaxID=2862949 RepID=UPI001CD79CFE|nr:NAD-dependent epimerase/dehydratase family protein [Nocardia sp. alder85J]MCX4092750.1 NAD-dependent epimerase/dehydratase family protein [Nocardia sp. alder85J]